MCWILSAVSPLRPPLTQQVVGGAPGFISPARSPESGHQWPLPMPADNIGQYWAQLRYERHPCVYVHKLFLNILHALSTAFPGNIVSIGARDSREVPSHAHNEIVLILGTKNLLLSYLINVWWFFLLMSCQIDIYHQKFHSLLKLIMSL